MSSFQHLINLLLMHPTDRIYPKNQEKKINFINYNGGQMRRYAFISIFFSLLLSLCSCGSSSTGGGDQGSKIVIGTTALPSGQKGYDYKAELSVTGGSGEYLYEIKNITNNDVIFKNISIDEGTGIFSGIVDVDPGIYNIEITITDKNYKDNSDTKTFILNIVQSLPDEYENDDIFPANSTDPSELNIIKPGDLEQKHSIHSNTDNDFLILDLSDVESGDEIMIETLFLSTPTNTEIQLYDNTVMIADNNDITTNKNLYSRLFFLCEVPSTYYLKINSFNNNIGDYVLRIKNTKKPLLIQTNDLLTAINSFTYSDQIIASGGSNTFIYSATGLPKNLFINTDTGIISGIVGTAIGEYDVVITVADKAFPEKQSIKTIPLSVYAGMNIKTEKVIDAKINSNYSAKINVEGGSGDYTYTAVNLPKGLQINPITGEINGTVFDLTENYNFTVTLSDNITKQKIDKNYTIFVVEFYPDIYEELNDNSIDTVLNSIKPDESQDHNFNYAGDIDYLKLDLSSIQQDHVIKIETNQFTTLTDTNLTLFSNLKSVITSNNNIGESNYSCIIFTCKQPEVFYLKVENAGNHVGDYKISVTDTGPKIEITTNILNDALKNSPYSAQINVKGGSRHYKYSISNQPGNLTLSQEGLLSGNITAMPGNYVFNIRIDDTIYKGIYSEKSYSLNVVDFLPDSHESDDSFQTSKNINFDEIQSHTFNEKGDKDYSILDLTGVKPGDIIKIETTKLTQDTDTVISLYDKNQSQIIANNDFSGESKYSKIIFQCFLPEIYYLLCQEMMGNVGDYNLFYTNTGAQVIIVQGSIPNALTGAVYSQQINVNGGSGHYTYEAQDLPIGMNVDDNGVISGVPIYSGNYNIRFIAYDKINPENYESKNITLNVVDFFSDAYEMDNNFSSSKTIKPGESQDHNFNYAGDIDYIRCDLSGILAGDVIILKTSHLTKSTDTIMTLYNSDLNAVANDDNSGGDNYSKITYHCTIPGMNYIKIENNTGGVGDYSISITNSGQKITINPSSLDYAESVAVYNQKITAIGGSSIRYQIDSGNLPGGLYLDPNTGQITGTNYNNGKFDFNIRAYDTAYPENYDIKSFSINAYIGKKVIANDIEHGLTWVKHECFGCGSSGYGEFSPTVNASHGLSYEEVDIPSELSEWKESGKYNFNPGTGGVTMGFRSSTFIDGVRIQNDQPLIRDSNGQWRKHTFTYKVYDVSYPENFDYFTYTVNMQH